MLVVGFVVLLGIVALTFWLADRSQLYFDQVIGARDLRAASVELRSALQTAESSQRGFLFTGNQIYLAPYDAAKRLAVRQFDLVKRFLAPSQEFASRIERLTELLSDKITEMESTIGLKRDRKDAEVLTAVRTNRGKAIMDEANVFLNGIIRIADERLTNAVSEQRENASWLRWLSIVGGMIIVVVVSGAALAVVRYTRELGAARDEVTALNAGLEARVHERTAELAQVNHEIQRFAYIMTHDLRAPLVNIMGFTSELEISAESLKVLVDQSPQRPEAAVEAARIAATQDLPEAISFIRSSTQKMDSLINAILKLSREGRRERRPELVDLGAVIAASTAAIQHQVSAAKGTVDLDVDVGQMVTDRASLEHVIGNILDNAVKYRVKERPLRIKVVARQRSDGRIAVDIIDNGRGIADHDRERVFELFRRSGTQDQPGEGIGLAYVRTIARNLGGDVSVTSVLGEGTTFHVVLPRSISAAGEFPT